MILSRISLLILCMVWKNSIFSLKNILKALKKLYIQKIDGKSISHLKMITTIKIA